VVIDVGVTQRKVQNSRDLHSLMWTNHNFEKGGGGGGGEGFGVVQVCIGCKVQRERKKRRKEVRPTETGNIERIEERGQGLNCSIHELKNQSI